MKPKVYIETTIPSYLTAWQSKDAARAEDQQITREWWLKRQSFDLYISELVIEECQAGDQEAAIDRLAALDGLPLLDQTLETRALAEELMREVPLPEKAQSDAIHIATAAVYEMQYLLTWNCRHIANAVLRPYIEAVCRAAGYKPSLICTPKELWPEVASND
jgi:predicted nucleic acid-binding protein